MGWGILARSLSDMGCPWLFSAEGPAVGETLETAAPAPPAADAAEGG